MSAFYGLHTDAPRRFFVVMGVCGVGKSTIAAAIAETIGGNMVESDALHSSENVEAMSNGRPLTDEQRWPWLHAVCDAALAHDAGEPVVIACSALARRYRDLIRQRLPGVVFVHLQGDEDLIRTRLRERGPHFMAPGMLDSQLSVLEPTDDEFDCHELDIAGPLDAVAAQAVSICGSHLEGRPAGAPGDARTNQDPS